VILGSAIAAASESSRPPGESKGGDSLIPVVRQIASNVLGVSQSASSFSVQFARPTLPGSAIWVVVSSPDHDYPSPFTFAVSDSQKNHYEFVGQKNDFNNGIQSVAHFVALSTKGDPQCDPSCSDTGPGETVTFNLLENGSPASDNYLAIFVVEVTGLGASHSGELDSEHPEHPLTYGHSEHIDVDPPAGADKVSSGSIATRSPVFLLAVSANVDGGASDTGGSGSGGPWAASNLSGPGPMFWKFDGVTPLATFATGVLQPVAEAVTAYFDAPPEPAPSVVNKNEYVTVAIAFRLPVDNH
jgi:hypothetical protein